jgi:hypothetical protein
MKRPFVPLALAAFLATTACSDYKVVVHAQLENGAVADLPVVLLNYDRKAILDSLARAYKVPQPAFPQELIQQIQGLSAEEQAAHARGDTAVARVEALRRTLLARADSIRAAQRAWADRAYARFDTIVTKRTARNGMLVREDTTDKQGMAVLPADHGEFWVTAQYTLPYSRLEWSVPVKLVKGEVDSAVVKLTRRNAIEKPSL